MAGNKTLLDIAMSHMNPNDEHSVLRSLAFYVAKVEQQRMEAYWRDDRSIGKSYDRISEPMEVAIENYRKVLPNKPFASFTDEHVEKKIGHEMLKYLSKLNVRGGIEPGIFGDLFRKAREYAGEDTSKYSSVKEYLNDKFVDMERMTSVSEMTAMVDRGDPRSN